MTKLRAFHSALACGALSLTLGGATFAGVANYTINQGSQSNVDNSCVGALPGATGEDCTYNQANDDGSLWTTFAWVGPVLASGYYRAGDSPFQQNPGTLPQKPIPDPNNASLVITGSLAIDDMDDIACNGNDTISGRFEVEAGTRTFSGAPGTWGEETWGDNTIVYVLPASVPDHQNDVGGCEYIFGSQGFPPFLQTLGGLTYPADTDIMSNAAATTPPATDAWDTASNPSGIGVGTFEGPNFQGNIGVEVSIDPVAFAAGTFECSHNFGGIDNPVVGDNCAAKPAADGTPCDPEGSQFCGSRTVQENWIMRIVVDPSGDFITSGQAFANNESIVFNIAPAPDANNSWDGPVITFQGTCDTCSVAKNDTYNFVTGTSATVSLPIGANDDPGGIMDSGNTSLAIDAPGEQRGSCVLTGANPGDVTGIGCDYTSDDAFASAGNDTFTYTIDDGVATPDLGLQATVSITVEDDTAPAANAYTIDFDTRGVDPATLRNTTDVLIDVVGNSGGNDPTVTADNTAQSGTVGVSGSEITYTANGDFFSGTDMFNYTITDNNFGAPGGVAPEIAGPTVVTVNIPALLPMVETDIIDGGEVEAGETADFSAGITLGNGSIDQHIGDGGCDDGEVAINSLTDNGDGTAVVNGTYTAPDDFEGDITCTYTVEDGDGDTDEGTVTLVVTNTLVIKFPGSGSALGPWSLLFILFIPLLRSRRAHRPNRRARNANSGV